MKRLVSRLAKLYGDIRYLILDLLDYYFPRPVVIDEEGRRVIYGRTGDIYYLPDPNRPKGKGYVMLPDSEMDKPIVRWNWEWNPETGEEACYLGYLEGPVPMENRMSYSEYYRKYCGWEISFQEPPEDEDYEPFPDAIRVGLDEVLGLGLDDEKTPPSSEDAAYPLDSTRPQPAPKRGFL